MLFFKADVYCILLHYENIYTIFLMIYSLAYFIYLERFLLIYLRAN